jgi:predicted RNase H-like nuclease (RuvC/YqgF family)
MDKFLEYINTFYNKVKLIVYKTIKKIMFLFNKQRTLQKMYKPMISSRNKINFELNNNVKNLIEENRTLNIEIKALRNTNLQLKNKIASLQELLILKDL